MASRGGHRGDGGGGGHNPYYDPTQQQHLDPSGYGGYGQQQLARYPPQQQQQYQDPSQQVEYYGMEDVMQQQQHQEYYETTGMDAYQQQQQPHDPYGYQEQGMDPYQQQQQHHGDPQQQYYAEDPSMQQAYYHDGSGMMMQQPWSTTPQPQSTEKGSYYLETEYTPELLYGHAVSALAYDPSYECMYVSGTTQTMSSTRFHVHRSSLLMTYTTTDALNAGNILFSSVAGHPEAPDSTLQAVYQTVYGIPKVLATPSIATGRRNFPPSHAYLPPYGGGSQAETAVMDAYGATAHQPQQPGHMGITELLSVGEGYVASVSPSAVRIHSYGGLQLNDYVTEGMLSGTIHPHSGPGGATHISVGGLSVAGIAAASGADTTTSSSSTYHKNNCNIHTLDLWQGLRPVYSRSFQKNSSSEPIAATAMATSHERGSVVVGCSDGNIRVFDGSLRELATIKSHAGGVSSISISPDGLLIATTGYSSKAKPTSSGGSANALYAYPDPKAYIYDIRYLGRGGISHPFAGLKGSPRFCRFLPDVEGCASNRLMVASGKPGGGMQIVTPFEPPDGNNTSFLIPQLQQGETMTSFSSPGEDGNMLGVGTSIGRVLNLRLSGFDDEKTSKTKTATSSPFSKTSGASSRPLSQATASDPKTQLKKALEIPDFLPKMPPLSLDPTLLQGDPNVRNGPEEIRSIFGAYTLLADPIVTYIGNFPEDASITFGVIGSAPIVDDCRRTVAASLLKEATVGEREFMKIVSTSKIGIDLLANQNVVSKRYKGKKIKDSIPNPNKMLYNQKVSSLCYEDGMNGKRKQPSRGRTGDNNGSSGNMNVPPRYKRQVRPGFNASGVFDPSEYNNTGFFPGYDYEPSMPNAWMSPVLLLFYYIPEVRAAALAMQVHKENIDIKVYEKSVAPELGFVFHQMESLSRYGLLYPPKGRNQTFRPRIGAWVPSNLLTFISTMPEAEQLQVLDGSPAAVDRPRRPESFYRFLAYQFDKELGAFGISQTTQQLMDSLNGLDFFGSNQYIESKSSPPTQSVTRALTLDLNYDIFPPGAEKRPIRFGQLLQHSLCRATRLRAWNSKSNAYETIVQRKIATSLPKILTLSCACAGRKEEDGLWAWRTDHGHEPWLPEMVEIELLDDGNVEVTEFHQAADGSGATLSKFRGKGSLPEQVSKIVSEASTKQKYRYRLDAVLSFIIDTDGEDIESDEVMGHHVLHSRIPFEYKCHLMREQVSEARKAAKSRESIQKAGMQARSLVLSADITAEEFQQRASKVQADVKAFENEPSPSNSDSDWVLYNGFKVSKASCDDARAFHVSFKEPVIVVFQAVDEEGIPVRDTVRAISCFQDQDLCLPPSAIKPRSLSSVSKGASTGFEPKLEEQRPLAFDAEFVAVQEEESTLAEDGQKIILRETRHTLGRISVFDCVDQQVLIDDHVLPREPVVDYLTRFSGIMAEDLDPSKARHRIISTRSAYLQLRYLLQKGCIFVGHGLRQDFATVNLAVPPTNILDTVEIFHQPGMRYISLRFLANYVLGRDMQQDVHDSVEDARAAYELYQKALQWKKEGVWNERLQQIYSYGDKTSWKLGAAGIS